MAVAPQISESASTGNAGKWNTWPSRVSAPDDPPGIEQRVERDLENPPDLSVRWRQQGPRAGDRDDRMQAKPAHGDVDRRERAEHSDRRRRQRNLFVRFAQRGLLERFASLHHAARQGHLAAVTIERMRPNGEHDVRTIVYREQQQQSGRVPDVGQLKPRRPLTRRLRAISACAARPGSGACSDVSSVATMRSKCGSGVTLRLCLKALPQRAQS